MLQVSFTFLSKVRKFETNFVKPKKKNDKRPLKMVVFYFVFVLTSEIVGR